MKLQVGQRFVYIANGYKPFDFLIEIKELKGQSELSKNYVQGLVLQAYDYHSDRIGKIISCGSLPEIGDETKNYYWEYLAGQDKI
jgi:hypothetical protein